MANALKVCRCGEVYDHEGWNALELRGLQEDGRGGELELRNCVTCGSTMCVDASEPLWGARGEAVADTIPAPPPMKLPLIAFALSLCVMSGVGCERVADAQGLGPRVEHLAGSVYRFTDDKGRDVYMNGAGSIFVVEGGRP